MLALLPLLTDEYYSYFGLFVIAIVYFILCHTKHSVRQ